MRNKYFIPCVKSHLLKIMQDFAVEILRIRYFGKYSMFLVKHNSIFGAGYYNRKNDIFLFTDFICNMFYNKILRKKNFQ